MTTSKLNRLFLLWVIVFGCAFAEPAWLEGKPMNQWFEINGTSGAGGSPINPWGGFTLREDTTELFIAASGGHGDSYDNRVVSIKLTDDQPQWIMRHEPTPQDQVVQNVPYYKDGLPTSRHSYQHNLWVPAVNRIMLCGAYGVYGGGWAFPTIDGFNPDTNQWDPAGTWPNITRGYGAIRETNSSIVWANGLVRIDFEKKEQTQPITKTANIFTRWPWAHDTRRHQLFTLQFGDGQGYNSDLGIQSSRIPLNPGDTQYKVTFKNSSAVDLFISEAPVYSAMDYDPVNDRFLFYYGQLTSAGRIYVITPNDGSDNWEMSILPLADGSAIPPAAFGSGINKRFLYVPGLNVFVMQPISDSNIWFIRVGNFEQIPQTAPYVAPPQSMNSPQSTNSPQSSSSPQSSNVPKARTSDVTQVTSSLAMLLILCVLF